MRRTAVLLSLGLLLAGMTTVHHRPPVALGAAPAKKTCKTVTKKVHGKKTKVRVCQSVKTVPTRTPTPTATTAPTATTTPTNSPTPMPTATPTPTQPSTYAWQDHEAPRSQDVAYFVVNIPNRPPALSETDVTDILTGSGSPQRGEVATQNFWDGQRIHFNFIDKGTYTLDEPTATKDACSAQLGVDELAFAEHIDQTISQYKTVVIVNSPLDCQWNAQSILYNGEGYVLVNKNISASAFDHELGHLQKENHAGTETVSPLHTYSLAATSTKNEYGSNDSVMGSGHAGLNIVDSLVIGNVKTEQTPLVTQSGDYTIYRRDMVGNGPYAIKLPTSSQDGMYDAVDGQLPQRVIYFEYESSTSGAPDSSLNHTKVNAIEWDDIVRFDRNQNGYLADKSWQIDSFAMGETFHNQVDGYSVTVESQTVDSVVIHVNMGQG